MINNNRRKPIASRIFLICSLILVILTACRPAQRPFPQTTPPGNVPPGQMLPTPNPANALGDAALGLQIPLVQASREQMLAYRISNDLINMPEVDRVNVLVTGDSAIIGFMPSSGYKDVSAIRDAIIGRVNALNLPITKILATESADAMIRINMINKNILNNRPTAEINAEIDQLMGRLMPVAAP